jgi:protease I
MHVRRAVIIASSGFCDRDVVYAYYRCLEEGWQVDVATPTGDPVEGLYGVPVPLDPAAKPNVSFSALEQVDYDAALLPGGPLPTAPDEPDERVAGFLDAMTTAGKVVAGLSQDAWGRAKSAAKANPGEAGEAPEAPDADSARRDQVWLAGMAGKVDVIVDGTHVTCTGPAYVGRLMRTVFETTERLAADPARLAADSSPPAADPARLAADSSPPAADPARLAADSSPPAADAARPARVSAA